jgi:hypothetical protein
LKTLEDGKTSQVHDRNNIVNMAILSKAIYYAMPTKIIHRNREIIPKINMDS